MNEWIDCVRAKYENNILTRLNVMFVQFYLNIMHFISEHDRTEHICLYIYVRMTHSTLSNDALKAKCRMTFLYVSHRWKIKHTYPVQWSRFWAFYSISHMHSNSVIYLRSFHSNGVWEIYWILVRTMKWKSEFVVCNQTMNVARIELFCLHSAHHIRNLPVTTANFS